MSDMIPDLVRKRLENQMRRGQLLLFTGAGFSIGAVNKAGVSVPTVNQLKRLLWPLAFPTQSFDPHSTLSDTLHIAKRQAGNATRDLLREQLTVEPQSLPDWYRIWFAAPWKRIYTVNIDNLSDVAGRRFELPRAIKSFSALTSETLPPPAQLYCVHVNGRVAEYPQVTFTPFDYGRRAAGPDPWYDILTAELSNQPVVFVGTQLDEPPLWQHIELRKMLRGGREQRPGSILVSPSLPVARQGILRELNVNLVEATAEDFARDVLQHMPLEYEAGLRVLQQQKHADQQYDPNLLPEVARLRSRKVEDLAGYLLGRRPTWADLTEGYAVERTFEHNLGDSINAADSRVHILTGTAGSGKSTTLMRLALKQQADGRDVRWMDTTTGVSLRAIRRQVKDANVDVLCVDDADTFGRATASLLHDLARDNPSLRIVAAVRSTRFDSDDWDNEFGSEVSVDIRRVPHLGDEDIDLLIDALTDAKRLGTLRALNRVKQRQAFEKKAGRQLLVALIEATSGEKLEDKVSSECQDLDADLAVVYAVVVVATNRRLFLTRDEILLAVQSTVTDGASSLRKLQDQHLVVVEDGRYTVRHRVIADKALRYFRTHGLMREPLIGLLWALASKVYPKQPRHSRELKLLIDLMNHKTLAQLTDSNETPRLAYERIEGLLDDNHHFWLQRGSYELDHGDMQLASNYLEQARRMAPEDPLIQTAWAHMALRRAAERPSAPGAQETAYDALDQLELAIEQRGSRDTYPYHVMGSQGLHWSRRAILTPEDRRRLLARLKNVVDEGAARHPTQRDLRQLLTDVQKEYLSLAVVAREPDE